MIAILCLLTCPSPWITSHVDTIERNHVYDWQGNHKLSQVIFWRDERVVAWCQNDDAGAPRRVGGQWRMDVRTQGKWYRVQSPAYRETWTQLIHVSKLWPTLSRSGV